MLEVTLDGRRVYQRRNDLEEPRLAVHPTPEAAREIAERIVQRAVDAGMILVGETGPLVSTFTLEAARDPELVRLCRSAPDDPAPRAVYADWLMAHGDVRGELAALVHGRDPSAV